MPRFEAEEWPDLPPSAENRYAVAIHEAGHAVVYACCRFDVQRMQISRPGSKLTGCTTPWGDPGERTDLVAAGLAGDIAVEVICGPSLAAVLKSVADQQRIQSIRRDIDFTDDEMEVADATAREIIEAQRKHVIAVADALIAAPDGLLEGDALDGLLTSVRDECERSRL